MKINGLVISLVGGIFTSVFIPWAFWVSKELYQMKDDIAVIRFKLFNVAESVKPRALGPSSYAFPMLITPPDTKKNQ